MPDIGTCSLGCCWRDDRNHPMASHGLGHSSRIWGTTGAEELPHLAEVFRLGKKVRINNYPMTIIGVSAAGFVGLDPAQSPQVRVPILMKPAMVPEWPWLQMDDRRQRWVQVFARLKPGYTVESAAAPVQGLFHQIREYEMTLSAAAKWSAYARDQFMKGQMHVEKAATGYSELRNSFSTALSV